MATIREAVSALVRDLTNCADITCHGERSLVAEVTAMIENEIRAEREACAMVCEAESAKVYDHAKPPYMACAKAIRAR